MISASNLDMRTNKITNLADGINDQDAVTVKQLNAARVGSIKPSGSIAFANLPALSAGVLHNLYNISDAFTTTADFVEGEGHDYPAGTNVAVINVGTAESPVYKYDSYTGTIDLSGLIKTATSIIGTMARSTTVNFEGTLINAYATMNDEIVMLDVSIGDGSVTFSTAVAPTSTIVCTVVYV